MDEFKQAGEKEQCVGGRKCQHCNPGHGKNGIVDKSFNRRARARVKSDTIKIIKDES
jgi:hypothetical protein